MTHAVLVQMPFHSLRRPNLGLSLLRSCAEQAGHKVEVKYLNVDFAARCGVPLHQVIAERTPQELLVADLIFASAAFGSVERTFDRIKEFRTHLESVPGRIGALPDWLLAELPSLSTLAEEFVDQIAHKLVREDIEVLGLSTLFQLVPSLALSRRYKELGGRAQVILGGSSCEAEMGMAVYSRFPWVDFVCRGEGENAFVALLDALAENRSDFSHIPALLSRHKESSTSNAMPLYSLTGLHSSPPQRVSPPLDDLPLPDYHDWLTQLATAGVQMDPDDLMLPIETSRGCWYGEKVHCTFCGLNGSTMRYRSKDWKKVLEEIEYLSTSYGIDSLFAVDNILDYKYFQTLLPELARLRHGMRIFYEVKSNLTHEQVRLLRDSGITWIQPGIESLSTSVLQTMRKGVTAIQNLQLLKFAAEYGMGVAWNILYGFPEEDPLEYEKMANLIPLITHLPPPLYDCNRVRLDRFSPLFVKGESAGLTNIRPCGAYATVFPPQYSDLTDLAYYFDYDYSVSRDPEGYVSSLRQATREWRSFTGSVALIKVDRDETLHLFDTRPVSVADTVELTGDERQILLACESAQTLESIVSQVHLPSDTVHRCLEELIELGVVVHLDGRYLGLAVSMDELIPKDTPLEILAETAHTLYCVRMQGPHKRILRGMYLPMEKVQDAAQTAVAE